MADLSMSSRESVSHSRLQEASLERPSARLRALLARTRPLEGNEVPEVYWEGRSLIESLALAYETETDYTWTLSQCATVLECLSIIEPTEGNCICNDTSDVNATCGLHIVYDNIAERLREKEAGHG